MGSSVIAEALQRLREGRRSGQIHELLWKTSVSTALEDAGRSWVEIWEAAAADPQVQLCQLCSWHPKQGSGLRLDCGNFILPMLRLYVRLQLVPHPSYVLHI
jgi:hypothetical protein